MRYRLLWGAAMFGVAVHLAGLAWDVWLHSNDATLAAREGVFTLGNPGHALVVVGVTITALALAAALILWTGEHAPRRVALGARLAALPVLGLAAGAAVWVTTQAETESHAHQQQHVVEVAHTAPHATQPAAVAATDPHPHTPGGESAAAANTSPMGNDHAHNEVNVSPEQLQAAAALVAKSNETAAKYADVRAALRDGYVQVTQDLEGIAAHFHHPRYASDGVLMDAEHPETLLYTKRMDGSWKLVGLMFSSEKPSDTPPSFFGALDAWHRHENLCFTPGAVSIKPDAASCHGGVFVPVTAWNLHVWTAPGATTGVFAHDFPPISPGAFPPAVRTAASELQVRAGQ